MKTTLDRFGRVLIPMEVRDHLGLNPGAVLEIVELEETILLKPKNDKVHVVVKAGYWSFQALPSEMLRVQDVFIGKSTSRK